MNSDGPQIISDFYLTVLLDSIRQNGYLIFAIVGKPLPLHPKSLFEGQLKKTQFYFTEKQVQKANEKRNKENNNEINLAGYDARDQKKMLDMARRQEMGQFGTGKGGYSAGGMDEEDEGHKPAEKKEEKKFFEGKGVSLGGNSSPLKKGSSVGWYDGDTDADTVECIKMSLKDVHSSSNLDLHKHTCSSTRSSNHQIQASRWQDSNVALQAN